MTGFLRTNEAPWCCLIDLLLEEEKSDFEMFCHRHSGGKLMQLMCEAVVDSSKTHDSYSYFSASLPADILEPGTGQGHVSQRPDSACTRELSTHLPCRRGEACAITKKSI